MRLCLSKSGLAESHRSGRGDLACVDYAWAGDSRKVTPRSRQVSAVLSGDQSAAYVAATRLFALTVASAAVGAFVGLVIW